MIRGNYKIFYDRNFLPEAPDWWIMKIDEGFKSILPLQTHEDYWEAGTTPIEKLDEFYERMNIKFQETAQKASKVV